MILLRETSCYASAKFLAYVDEYYIYTVQLICLRNIHMISYVYTQYVYTTGRWCKDAAYDLPSYGRMPSCPEAEALQQWICARNDAAARHLYPDVLPCLDSWIACWNVWLYLVGIYMYIYELYIM